MQAQHEHRRRRLRGEQGARRAVQGVVALFRGEAGGVAEGLQVRKDDVVLPQRRALLRIARARKQPVVLVEGVLVVGEREPQVREVGLPGAHRALALIHREAELHRAAVHLLAADAVGAADLEAERRGVRRHRRSGVVHQSQRVDVRGVLGGGDGEGADAAPRARAVRLPRGDVRDREVITLVEPRGEGEPRAAGVHVVVAALLEDLPLERSGALVGAVHGGGPDAAGDRPHPAEVLVAGAPRRDGAHPVDAQAADAQ